MLHIAKVWSMARAERWKEAREAFLIGRQSAPSDIRFPLELAGVAYKSGNRREAISELRKALALDPDDNYANDALGSIYLLEGQLEAALVTWNRIGKPVIKDVVLDVGSLSELAAFKRTVTVQSGEVFLLKKFYETQANIQRFRVSSFKMDLVAAGDGQFNLVLSGSPHDNQRSAGLGSFLIKRASV